jgi:hypothetical protein
MLSALCLLLMLGVGLVALLVRAMLGQRRTGMGV